MRNNGWRLIFIAFMFMAFSTSSLANDIAQLQRSGGVQIKSWLNDRQDIKQPEQVTINEQLTLYIEVSTPRWFTGGTRIGGIEIPDVIAKQRSQLAVNYAERRKGATWSVQLWELDLYPQKSGEFVIPPLAVQVQVSIDSGVNVKGNLYTEPLRFTASVPSGLLTEETLWINSPKAEISQQWQQSNQELKAGDTITRTISVEATDTLSVLLPPIMTTDSVNRSNRYQAYAKPVRLSDTQNRGQYQAQRVEEEVYVLQTGGEHSFPEYSISWWDSDKGELRELRLEGQSFKVSHTFSSWMRYYKDNLLITLFVFISVIGFYLALKRYYNSQPKPAWWLFVQELKLGNEQRIRACLYARLRSQSGDLQLSALSSSADWQILAKQIQHEKISFIKGCSLWRELGRLANQKNEQRKSHYLALPQLARLNERYKGPKS
ncbi:BatD family protein [Vibrio breoganii]